MKILLVGEFSGLHSTLGKGLKELGNDVTVISQGSGWKNHPRDINLSFSGKFKSIKSLLAMLFSLHRMIGYDVVQLISPNAIEAKPWKNKLLFYFLYLTNKNIFLGAYGDDYYTAKAGVEGAFYKSIYNFKEHYGDPFIKDNLLRCLQPDYKSLNEIVARKAKGIIACCAEYYIAYTKEFKYKLQFIGLPFDTDAFTYCNSLNQKTEKLKIFMGHYRDRRVLKGTDVMERVLLRLQKENPNEVELRIVDSIPFDEYKKLMDSSHLLVDQLYSHGYGMNGVLGLTKGLVVLGGASPYMYELIGEDENMPLIDLPIDEEEMFNVLQKLVINRQELLSKSHASREYAQKHHDYIKIAKEYVGFWDSKMKL